MIQKKKIEQAAVSHHKQMDYVQADLTLTIQDFTAGVRFAEEEMKQQAQEFAEWCVENAYSYTEAMELDIPINVGRWIHCNSNSITTTAELYAKFEAEMNQQNNGG